MGIQEAVGISERKAAALSGEAEESRALIDSADRSKRQIEAEIGDARAAVNEIQSINARDMSSKRSLEGSIHTLQAEIDAMVDAARLADELRAEQDHATSMASAKNALNNQFGDLEARLADAEAAAAKGGKAAMAKLEGKIRELEAELAGT